MPKRVKQTGNLTCEQMKKICLWRLDNSALTQGQLVLSDQREFYLMKPPSQGTISAVVVQTEKLLKTPDIDLHAKRVRSVAFPEVDEAVAVSRHHTTVTLRLSPHPSSVNNQNVIVRAKQSGSPWIRGAGFTLRSHTDLDATERVTVHGRKEGGFSLHLLFNHFACCFREDTSSSQHRECDNKEFFHREIALQDVASWVRSSALVGD